MEKEKGEFPIQTYSIKELAKHYRFSTKTLKRNIKRLNVDLGPRLGNMFSPKQVRIIVDNLGKPLSWLVAFVVSMFAGLDGSADGADADGGEGKGDGLSKTGKS